MGRKGGGKAGFMKSQMRHKEEEPVDDAPAPTTAAPGPSGAEEAQQPAPKSKASAFLVDTEEEGGASDPGTQASVLNAAGETRGQMAQRHKREQKAMKEHAKRLGKKGRDESAAQQAALDTKQHGEMEGMEAAEAAGAVDGLTLEEGQPAVEAAQEQLKQTKAQRKRAQRAAKDAERDARIATELAESGDSLRVQEEAALLCTLSPLGLTVHEISPDGHCLYRALEHQLSLQGSDEGRTFQDLRRLAAAHMRAHAETFEPYIAEDDVEGAVGEEGVFEAYCAQLESTATWGGHLELEALAAALSRPIVVHAVGVAPTWVGTDQSGETLQVCYLHHAYGLGEHYNSLVPTKTKEEGSEETEGKAQQDQAEDAVEG